MFEGRVQPLFHHQVQGSNTGIFKVRPGGIEMGVIGDDFAVAAVTGNDRCENMFRGPALVSGDDVLEGHQLPDRFLEAVEGG